MRERSEPVKNMTTTEIYSTLYGRIEVDQLQPIISRHRDPGLIYIPPGRWEGNIIVAQHNLTLVGAGNEETIIVGEDGRPAITINAPNVRVHDLAVRTEYNHPAISFTDGEAPQGVVQNVDILESGSHGVFRGENHPSPINAIVNCHFENIAGAGIYVESGAGPQNLVKGNTGGSIEGDFIKWGVDASLLLDNKSDDKPIHLTSDSNYNYISIDENVELNDQSETNVII